MKNESVPPEKPAIPPPNLPKPPPPDLPKPPPPDLPKPPPPNLPKPPPEQTFAGPPRVKVEAKEPGDPAADAQPPGDGIAPFNDRILAAGIDMLVAAGLYLASVWLLPSFVEWLAGLVGIAYLITRDWLPFFEGQSIGKKIMKLRAVTMDGKPLTGDWQPSLIRNGVLVIPFFGLVELFVLLTREEKPGHGLRLGDEWAKTKVIVEPEPATAADDGGNPG